MIDEYKRSIYNEYVRKRMRKLWWKKFFICATSPLWCLPLVFYVLGKDLWRDISWWVEKRNPGPTREE
jgi:hypothetical protein